ncbi:hypothetical protein QQS21_010160 [Conoideocrella luteorostrata]|uniref:DUF4470 domain-containing protein n=1 Tax=Conoideocrella luteorostrata TaxID=1105319 RepID=A0AAJ0FPP2_9HYPO|nr:hypothetical protein QQS21_010160 [Conoideocrella luteorostrata]
MLLLLHLDDDAERASHNVIQLWYSAFIPQSLLGELQGPIAELIRRVNDEIHQETQGKVHSATFPFEKGSIQLTLTREAWLSLTDYLQPPKITMRNARYLRIAVTLAPHRVDYMEESFVRQDPSTRLGAYKFREDGVLLPLGLSKASYNVPNPTMFSNSQIWPMMDYANPLDGWAAQDVDQASGAAEKDVYGKLFYYLLDLIAKVHRRLNNANISFRVFNDDAAVLAEHLCDERFDRIEVSNVSDIGYLGPRPCVDILGSLLKAPKCNQHATLITLFMSAVCDMVTIEEAAPELPHGFQWWEDILNLWIQDRHFDARMACLYKCRDMVFDYDKYFQQYMALHEFETIGTSLDLEMKSQNTVIEEWPMRVKLLPDQPGAKEEFGKVLASSHVGWERYVEWKVAPR